LVKVRYQASRNIEQPIRAGLICWAAQIPHRLPVELIHPFPSSLTPGFSLSSTHMHLRRCATLYPSAFAQATYGEDITMQAAIGYLRVSTQEQGRSGVTVRSLKALLRRNRLLILATKLISQSFEAITLPLDELQTQGSPLIHGASVHLV
jgi:hypothetical protein